jgi:hypothetical protein
MVPKVDISKSGFASKKKSGFFGDAEKGRKSKGDGGGVLEDMGDVCTLTWKQRLIGFCICSGIGVLLCVLSYITLVFPPGFGPKKIKKFAIIFTVGNIVAILSTGFLVGPMRQFRKMLEGGRIFFTAAYLISMGLTLFFAFKNKLVPCIICLIIQVIAFICYALSYMPIIRRVVVHALGLNKIKKELSSEKSSAKG